MHGARGNDPRSWTIPYKTDDELTYAKGYKYPVGGKYQNSEIFNAFAEAGRQGLKGKKAKVFVKKQGMLPSTECLDVPDDAYSDGAIAEAGTKQLEKLSKKQKPFFLALGFHRPHLPFVAPKKYWDMYDEDKIPLAPVRRIPENSSPLSLHNSGEFNSYKLGDEKASLKGPVSEEYERKLRHAYFACVSYVDAQVGKVLDELKRLGLDKNTVVVVWGDHGWHLGDQLVWGKHTIFERAVKSTLIVKAPGMANGVKNENVVSTIDLYPTISELCGLKAPDWVDGKSTDPLHYPVQERRKLHFFC
jgi:arylsulfatase A-like enzyme